MARAAHRRDIPCRAVAAGVVQLGLGVYQRHLGTAVSPYATPNVAGPADAAAHAVAVVGWRAFGGDLAPDVLRLAERAADRYGLDVATVTVTAGPSPEVTVVSAGVDLGAHPRDADAIADAIVAQLFPPGAPARIPVAVVIGGGEVRDRLGALLASAGHRVGLADDSSILDHPHVDLAVIRTIPGAGLALDRCDLLVVGADACPDLSGTLLPTVCRTGGVVLHADHPQVDQLAAATDARAVYVGDRSDHPRLAARAGSGGSIVYGARGSVVVRHAGRAEPLVDHAEPPGELLLALAGWWSLGGPARSAGSMRLRPGPSGDPTRPSVRVA
ncbi:MAG: hypothetical protein ABMB14_07815 [Myxococcota bacterium]